MIHNDTPSSQDDPFRAGAQCLLVLLGNRYFAAILEITPTAIRTSFPVSNLPQEGMMVQLEFHDRTGYVNFETQVLAAPKHAGDGLLLERPKDIKLARRRGAWRVPADLKASLKSHVHPRRHHVTVINISAGGMLVKASAPLQLGDNVDITMQIPGEDIDSPLLGEVAHIVHAPDAVETSVLAGIRFIALDPVSAQGIANYVWRRMRALYPEHRSFLGSASE